MYSIMSDTPKVPSEIQEMQARAVWQDGLASWNDADLELTRTWN